VLKIADIHVYRGRTHVLKGVSLEVDRGDIVALIGANGAGKTTLLRTLSGLLRPRRGAIRFRAQADGPEVDLTRLAAEDIVGLGISHCPEGRGVFARLSVRENLLIGAYRRRDRGGIEEDYRRVRAIFPILEERSGQAAGSLSGGEQEMLALGRALMSRPALLILDEPSLGLGPLIVARLFEVLAEINRQGVTLLLVEQNAVAALNLARRAYVLETGRMVLAGPSAELLEDPNVRRAYLGGAA
jgi:branched-chain amino acid transport system ATP-binding protein